MYSSLYKVLERSIKSWKVQVGEQLDIISRDRVLECGNKSRKVQVGERVDIISRDPLKPHLGGMPRRLRTAFVTSVASASAAAKPGGPVYCVAAWDYISQGDDCTV